MLVIFYLSSEGHDASSGRSDEIVNALKQYVATVPTDFLTFLTRKAAHTIAYLILGIFMFQVVSAYRAGPLKVRTVLFSIGFVLLYAISDEFHQSFVPGRAPMVTDVLIDTTAASLSILISHFIAKDKHGKKINETI